MHLNANNCVQRLSKTCAKLAAVSNHISRFPESCAGVAEATHPMLALYEQELVPLVAVKHMACDEQLGTELHSIGFLMSLTFSKCPKRLRVLHGSHGGEKM